MFAGPSTSGSTQIGPRNRPTNATTTFVFPAALHGPHTNSERCKKFAEQTTRPYARVVNIEIVERVSPSSRFTSQDCQRLAATIQGLSGWVVVFDVGRTSGQIEALALERDASDNRTSLTTTMLRQINPAELVAAGAARWIAAGDPMITAPTVRRWSRPDSYLAQLAAETLRLQASGIRRGRNTRLGQATNRKASQVSDDLRKCRVEGWLDVETSMGRSQGKSLDLLPGRRLLAQWQEIGPPEWYGNAAAQGHIATTSQSAQPTKGRRQ